jgi:hypothetical protein
MPNAPVPVAAVTIDLDTTPHYRAIHGLPAEQREAEAPDPTYLIGVERFLSLCDEHNVKATLFVIGTDTQAPAHRALLERAHRAGHELGNHSWSHRYDLRDRPSDERASELRRCSDALAAITGARPAGFRTPGYNLSDALLTEGARQGFLYDSSVFPCPPYYAAKGLIMAARSLTNNPSRSAMTDPRSLLAPITPYRPERGRWWRHDPHSALPWQIPMALIPGARIPVIGTSLHLLGARGFAAAWPLLKMTYKKLFQLEFHAIDFMDASDEGCAEFAEHQPDLRVSWSQKRELYRFVFKKMAQDYELETLAEGVRRL